jgi:membrane-associated phospholipid phosphatase
MAVDDYIPFVEYFIVPYLLWFGYVTYAVLYFLFKNKTEFYKLCIFLFTGMTVFLIVSTIYPNGQYLRPHAFAHDNVCIALVKWVYATDTPTNLFPSIHVYNSIGVHFAIINSESFRNNKRVRISSFILMVSIILSTMFLKQHSVFDVITAFVMAAVMYSFVYGKSFQFSRQKTYENQFHQI